jgi:phosphotransferase system enzyme I (PtsI)
LLALVLVGLGVGSLSMAVSKVPAIRLCLALHDLQSCQQMASAARCAGSATEAKASVLGLLHPDAAALI